MSKYIDKDKVLEYIIFGVVGKDITCGELKRAIESLPAIDIVRCKDCKHNPKYIKNFQNGKCVCTCDDDWYSYEPRDDFFCGYGERKDNE